MAAGEERGPAAVLASVLRVGRAGVRVAHGSLHLLQLAVRLHHRQVRRGQDGAEALLARGGARGQSARARVLQVPGLSGREREPGAG